MTSPPLDYATPGKRTGLRNGILIFVGLLTALVPSTLLFFSLNLYFVVPLIVGVLCAIAGVFRMEVNAKKWATTIGVLLCVVASLGPFLIAAWMNREGLPIKIVIPVGYHGEIRIVKDHTKGQALKEQDGWWVFEIPPSGELDVKETYPFHMWHNETHVYSDGTAADLQDLGVEAGNIVTGSGSSKGSTEYDGTTFRWKTPDK